MSAARVGACAAIKATILVVIFVLYDTHPRSWLRSDDKNQQLIRAIGKGHLAKSLAS